MFHLPFTSRVSFRSSLNIRLGTLQRIVILVFVNEAELMSMSDDNGLAVQQIC